MPINQLVFQSFCLETSCYHFGITVQLGIMSVLHFSHYKILKKSTKVDSKIKEIQHGKPIFYYLTSNHLQGAEFISIVPWKGYLIIQWWLLGHQNSHVGLIQTPLDDIIPYKVLPNLNLASGEVKRHIKSEKHWAQAL